MTVRFRPEAREELRGAIDRYEAARPGLGIEFLLAVDDAIELVRRDPATFAFYEGHPNPSKHRRVLLERFPYVVVYQARVDEVLVTAVAHASRKPGYWEGRD